MSNKLESLLEFYDDYYYNKDESLISDAEYDAIKRAYLNQNDLVDYEKVSGSATEDRVKHKYKALSLTEFQITDMEKIIEEVERLGYPVSIQPKYDGLTVIFEDGKVTTRGDGEYGEDITKNCLNIEGVKRILSTDLCIRGEALIFKNTFNKINEKRKEEGLELYKNPRNTASGMLRRKHSEPEGIFIYLYDIMGSKLSVSEKNTILSMFNSKDISVTYSMNIHNKEELYEFLYELEKDDLDEFPFETDGLVVKSNKRDSLKKFGTTGHHPKDSFAIKFPVEGKWTKIKGITHQVGRTGKIVPVAELEPVEIMGTTVNRATLHNIEYVKAFNLDIIYSNTRVKVTKANEIIPAIIETKLVEEENPIVLGTGIISRCPVCNSELELVNEQQYCKNIACHAKDRLRLEHMAKRECFDIEGLSKATVDKLFDTKLINDPLEVFDLTVEEIKTLPGFGEKSATNLFNAIQNSRKEIKLENFITSIGIEEVGKSTARIIAERFISFENFIGDIYNFGEELEKIDQIGPVTASNILKSVGLIDDLKEKVLFIKDFEKKSEEEIKGVVCISGKFDKSREELKEILESHNYKVVNSVTKKCTILLCKENKGSKYQKALDYNITIINNYEELLS